MRCSSSVRQYTRAMATQAVASVAVGVLLIVGALTAPAQPPATPVTVRWRPATADERRNYDVRQLAELLDEQQRSRQMEGATPAVTVVTPQNLTRTNPDEEGRSR